MKFVNIVRNSSGSVGIGTSEPSARLYVTGSYDASETTALFKAGFPSPLGGAGVLDVQNSAGTSLLFVSGSGAVGIGTTVSQLPSHRLHVSGKIGGGLFVDSSLEFLASGNTELKANTDLKLGYALTTVIRSTGNVGVGTLTPSSRLHVYGSSTSTTSTAIIQEGAAPTGGAAALDVQNVSGTSLFFVSGSGRVGIASTTPSARLEVNLGGSNAEILTLKTTYSPDNSYHSMTWRDGSNITGQIDTRYDGTTVDMVFGSLYNSGYNSAERLRIKGNGDVGIGTSSFTARLYVSGSSTSSTPTTIFKSGVSSPTGPIVDIQGNTGTTLMHVSGSGFVGIGTLNASQLLHLHGGSLLINTTGTGTNNDIYIGRTGGWSSGETHSLSVYYNGPTVGGTTVGGTMEFQYDGSKQNVNFRNLYNSGASTSILMTIQGNGNVGIGTSTATVRFAVSGSSTSSTPTMVVREGVASPTDGAGTFDVQNSAGTSLLFVSGSGNVGVGINVPTARLHVLAGNTNTAAIFSTANATQSYIQLAYNTSTTFGYVGNGTGLVTGGSNGDLALRSESGGNILFATAGSIERARFDTSGHLLPGTDVTYNLGSSTKRWANIYAVSISGSLTGSNVSAGQVVVAGSGGVLSGTNVFTWDNTNSRIGLGTNAAAYDIDVYKPNGTINLGYSSQAGFVRFGANASSIRHSSNEFGFYSGQTNGINFYPNNVFSVAFTNAGNVGIGTSNTNGNKLAVNGQTSITGSVLPGADNTYDLGSSSPQYRWRTLFATNISGSITPTGATAGSVFFAGASGQIAQDNANFFWDDTNNRLGIGTLSPGQSLSVVSSSPTVASFKGGTVTAVVYSDNSAAAFGDGTGGPGGAGTEFWYLHPGSLYASLYTNSAERMRVDSSGNVGINTTSMTLKLEVSGSDAKIHDVRIGRGPGSAITNTLAGGNSGGALGGGAVYATIFGAYAGNYISTGNYNTLVGTQAGNNITTASNNTYLGANAGYRQSGGNNTSVGRDALIGGIGASATANTAIGVYAGQSVTSGGNNFFGGYQAGYSTTTGASNVALGSLALYSVSVGNYNVGAGYQAGYGITSGSNNVNLGYQSGYGITTGAQNILVGTVSGYRITTANYNTHVGGNAGVYNSASGNATLGYQALAGVDGSSTGANNVAIGYQAAYGSTTGYENVVIGYIAGYSTTTGGRNVVIGSAAGNSISTGGGNVAIGYAASYRLTTNTEVTAVGNLALAYNTGASNTSLGSAALKGLDGQSTGGGNTAVGTNAGAVLTTGTYNSVLGYNTGLYLSTGTSNSFVGFRAGQNTSVGGYNVAIGIDAGVLNTSGSFNTSVGYQAGYSSLTTSNLTSIGGNANLYQTGTGLVAVGYGSLQGTSGQSTATSNTAIGYQAGYAVTTGGNNFFGGYQAGLNNSVATNNVFLGYQAGVAVTSGSNNTVVGYSAGYSLTTGDQNVVVGRTAGYTLTSEQYNTFVGMNAGRYTKSSQNTSLGFDALLGQSGGTSTGAYNVAVGYGAGRASQTGNGNVFTGYQSGLLATDGNYNTFIGYQAGDSVTTGGNNTIVGSGADLAAVTNTNSIVIGSGSIGIGSNTTVLGNSSTATTYLAGNVGIGTTSFTGRLYVSGSSSATPTIVARAGVPSPSAAILSVEDNDATTRLGVYGVSYGGYGGTFSVGIGTNGPFDTLHVHKNETGYDHYPWFSNAAAGGGTILTLQGDAPGSNAIRSFNSLSNESWYIGGNGSTGTLVFKTNGGNERMRIDTSGNVGIGTATVSARLHVLGSTTTTTPTMLVKERQASDTGVAILDVQNSSGTSLLFVSGSGFTGIGTNTQNATAVGSILHVSSSFAGNAASQLIIGAQLLGTSVNLYRGYTQVFQLANGTETMRITSAGNVGIGTNTNISSRLVVNGITSVTGSVLPGGDNTYDLGASSPPLRWRTLHAINISGSFSPTGATPGSVFFAGASGQIQQDNANLFWDDANDRLGVGTATPGFKLEVFGDFAATSKSFVIPHPLKPGWKLRYGSLEGPENGVYVRGTSESETIDLPDYWVPLVDESSITVQITPVGKWQSLYVESVENNRIKIGRGWFMRLFRIKPKYFYTVSAARKDSTFTVEYSPLG